MTHLLLSLFLRVAAFAAIGSIQVAGTVVSFDETQVVLQQGEKKWVVAKKLFSVSDFQVGKSAATRPLTMNELKAIKTSR